MTIFVSILLYFFLLGRTKVGKYLVEIVEEHLKGLLFGGSERRALSSGDCKTCISLTLSSSLDWLSSLGFCCSGGSSSKSFLVILKLFLMRVPLEGGMRVPLRGFA